MKRMIWLTLLGVWVGFGPGCEREGTPTPPSPLADAMRQLQLASAGHAADADFEGSLEAYQQEKLDGAREAFNRALEREAGDLSPTHLATAAEALATIDAEEARRLVGQAITSWARQVDTSAKAAHLFEQMAQLRDFASTYADAGPATTLSQLTLDLSEERENLQDYRSDVLKGLRDRIAGVKERIADLRQRQRAQSKRASELLSRAVDASGQERFDLYDRSLRRSAEADALAGRVDLAEHELSTLESELAIAEIEEARRRARIEVMEQVRQRVSKEQAALRTEVVEAERTADALQGRLIELLTARSEAHTREIVSRFDTAADRFERAVETLSEARDRLRGEDREGITLSLASKQTGLGFARREALLADRAYATLLMMVGQWARESLPSTNAGRQMLVDLAADAERRLEAARAGAAEELKAAADRLDDAASELVDVDAKVNALVMLVNVYGSLDTLLPEEGYGERMERAQAEADELRG